MLAWVALPGDASAYRKPGIITVVYQGCGVPAVNGTALPVPVRVKLKQGTKTIAERIVKDWGTPYQFVTTPGYYRIETKGMAIDRVKLHAGKTVREYVFCKDPVG
jgi:hypothetical protein